jgi:prepilin-type N-terminal cleavage/methylation domain-containing protein
VVTGGAASRPLPAGVLARRSARQEARVQRGFSTLEMVVVLSVFGVLIWILISLESEMFRNERRFPVNYMTHPEVIAVLARLRRDVLDSYNYPSRYPDQQTPLYEQTPKTLILGVIQPTGFSETVVWDFRVPKQARRISYNVGQVSSDWLARGLPDFNVKVDSYTMPDDTIAVRLQALDETGTLAIDQIYEPRSH